MMSALARGAVRKRVASMTAPTVRTLATLLSIKTSMSISSRHETTREGQTYISERSNCLAIDILLIDKDLYLTVVASARHSAHFGKSFAMILQRGREDPTVNEFSQKQIG